MWMNCNANHEQRPATSRTSRPNSPRRCNSRDPTRLPKPDVCNILATMFISRQAPGGPITTTASSNIQMRNTEVFALLRSQVQNTSVLSMQSPNDNKVIKPSRMKYCVTGIAVIDADLVQPEYQAILHVISHVNSHKTKCASHSAVQRVETLNKRMVKYDTLQATSADSCCRGCSRASKVHGGRARRNPINWHHHRPKATTTPPTTHPPPTQGKELQKSSTNNGKSEIGDQSKAKQTQAQKSTHFD